MTDLQEATDFGLPEALEPQGPEGLPEEALDDEDLDLDEEPRRFPWRVVLGLVVLAVLAGGIYFAWHKATDGKGRHVPVEVSGRPRLQVDRQMVDLGELKMGTPATATFEVANVGDEPLRFDPAPYTQVVKGCCTPPPTLGAAELSPGETTKLTLYFTMSGFGGPHDFLLHLQSNDPEQPDKTVEILSNWVQ